MTLEKMSTGPELEQKPKKQERLTEGEGSLLGNRDFEMFWIRTQKYKKARKFLTGVQNL
jgi:hypothetical protein